tara:strand:- start:20500 stop:20790 length:291 start_codon:yes stop_codon:yes gene_type:complete
MELVEHLRHLESTLPEGVDISARIKKIELAEKMGASTFELLMQLLLDFEPIRIENPTKYDEIRQFLAQLGEHLEGKQRFVWERIFPHTEEGSDDEA